MGRLQRKKKLVRKKPQEGGNGVSETMKHGGENDEKDAPGEKEGASTSEIQPKRPSPPPKRTVSAPKDNAITKSLQFLREVKAELKKVTWPSRKQAAGSTVVVILLVMIISLFLGIVDMGLSSLIRVILP